MANQDNENLPTGQEKDISKAQSAQQPPAQASQQPGPSGQRGEFEQGDAELTGDQAATGQAPSDAAPDEGLQGDTLAQRRTDVEGASLGKEKGEAESGFVGSRADQDTSSELIQDEDDEEPFAPEGK